MAAQELEIPALQLLARQRFAHTFQSHWTRYGNIRALIVDFYWRTQEGDPLRGLICQVVAATYDNEHESDLKVKIREIMTDDGEIATEVLDAVVRLRREWEEVE